MSFNKEELIAKMKSFLGFRKQAYQQTFNPEAKFSGAVLDDLAKFCRAHESTFHPDARIQAALEGRREVWLRIQNHLELDDETLWKLYGKK
jgi:hypothetical protein